MGSTAAIRYSIIHLLQGLTALHMAAAFGREEAIKVLLSLKAAVNVRDASVSFLC